MLRVYLITGTDRNGQERAGTGRNRQEPAGTGRNGLRNEQERTGTDFGTSRNGLRNEQERAETDRETGGTDRWRFISNDSITKSVHKIAWSALAHPSLRAWAGTDRLCRAMGKTGRNGPRYVFYYSLEIHMNYSTTKSMKYSVERICRLKRTHISGRNPSMGGYL